MDVSLGGERLLSVSSVYVLESECAIEEVLLDSQHCMFLKSYAIYGEWSLKYDEFGTEAMF